MYLFAICFFLILTFSRISFPPTLLVHLAEMWNFSESPYLVCYHGPQDIIHSYGFNVDLIHQLKTSMHGSKERHMAYIYKRSNNDSYADYVAALMEDLGHDDARRQEQGLSQYLPGFAPFPLPAIATPQCDRIYELYVFFLRCGFSSVERCISLNVSALLFEGPLTRSGVINRGPPLLQKCRKRKRGGTIDTTEEEEVTLKDITKKKI
jgi:hypothetical protein